jgi:hypothetical protein
MTRRLTALLLATGLLAAVLAPSAAADNGSFVDMLRANGEDVSSVDIQFAVIDEGLAICSMLNESESPTATVDSLVQLGHTKENANMWMAASVLNLCPELDFLTHYRRAAASQGCYLDLDRPLGCSH